MSNKNNPNCGGKGDSAISRIVPAKVTVGSPDHQPSHRALPGPTFEPGSPAGREAQPHLKVDGGDPILT